MILINSEMGRKLIDAIRSQIDILAHDIKERFGQQHTDYDYPKYYDASLTMLRDDRVQLKSIINLYETDFDRAKKKFKTFVKKILKIGLR